MPNRDRTGPRGMGPRTGRGLGPCGTGMRRGFGRGQGFQDMDDERRENLELENQELRKELKEIKRKLKS